MIAVENRIKEDLASGHIAGASVHVSQGGRTLYENHFGNVKPDSLFRIASMTKPVTAAAMMLLAERGELKLSDPVMKFLPGFPIDFMPKFSYNTSNI